MKREALRFSWLGGIFVVWMMLGLLVPPLAAREVGTGLFDDEFEEEEKPLPKAKAVETGSSPAGKPGNPPPVLIPVKVPEKKSVPVLPSADTGKPAAVPAPVKIPVKSSVPSVQAEKKGEGVSKPVKIPDLSVENGGRAALPVVSVPPAPAVAPKVAEKIPEVPSVPKTVSPDPVVEKEAGVLNTGKPGGMDFVTPAGAVADKDASAADVSTLQVGDRIKITIYPEDPYIKGGEMMISSEGNITLPLIGKVDVADLKVSEAERIIASKIDADYLVSPEVVIEVTKPSVTAASGATVVLMGAVRKTGVFDFPPETQKFTLLKLLSTSGGFTDVANSKKVRIVRKVDGEKSQTIRANVDEIVNGDDPDIDLQPGDIVNVPETLF